MFLSSFLDFDSKYFLEIGNFGISWYAFCILTGVILAVVMGVKEGKKFGINPTLITDGVLICVPLSILGARLYYVIFEWEQFYVEGDFGATFRHIIGLTDNGFQLAGLSITGGVIVAVIFVIVYSRIRKLNTLAIFDLLAPGLLIGQICGRWGNFFNQEAYGGIISEKTFSWLQYIIPPFVMDKMYILGEYRHPTFLYESMWNLLGLILIMIGRRKNKKARIGDFVCFYLIWYGLGRSILIEPFRTDALMLGDIRINILVPALFALCGAIWLVLKHTKLKAERYLDYQAQIKENKIDTVLVKLEDVLVSYDRLMKNAYYYTAQKFLEKEYSDDDLAELIKENPCEVFDEKAYKFYRNYLLNNISQLGVTKDCKEFFKMLFTHDYNVLIYSKFDKELIDLMLNELGIGIYVSVRLEENPTCKNALNTFKNQKNVMVITDSVDDLKLAKNHHAQTSLVSYSDYYDEAVEEGPTHIINRFPEMFNYIIE